MRIESIFLLGFFLGALALCPASRAADWPTWRHDPGRSGTSPEQLAADLHAVWTHSAGRSTPAWNDPRLQFDAHYEPVVMGERLYFASGRNDSVTALSIETGDVLWKFFAGGPVRLAPVVARSPEGERVYFGADDGCFYCVDAADGQLVWRFTVPMGRRQVLGNARLSSIFPVRGGPVISAGKIFFSAGFWPFEGSLLYGLDLEPGAASKTPQATVQNLGDRSPQGHLAAAAGRIILPAGRAKAICVDPVTQRFDSLAYDSKGFTDYHVSAQGRWLFHGDRILDRVANRLFDERAHRPVVTENALYTASNGVVEALSLRDGGREVTVTNRTGKEMKKRVLEKLWRLANEEILEDLPSEAEYADWLRRNPLRIAIKSGTRLYGFQGDRIFAIDVPSLKKPRVSWRWSLGERPAAMLSAQKRLFVVSEEGNIHCFGAQPGERPSRTRPEIAARPSDDDLWSRKARGLVERAGTKEGYCLVVGIGSGALLEALVRESSFHVIGLDRDAKKVDALRRKLDRSGLYGTRAVVQVGEVGDLSLPPYLANLITSEDPGGAGLAKASALGPVWEWLRPYGGALCIRLDVLEQEELSTWVSQRSAGDAEIALEGDLTVLRRVGALPGSSGWKQEYGDPGNTLTSRDTLVKAPLGLLWYGGPAGDPEIFYNRHNWPPSLAVSGGRMFVQGPGQLTAIDVYTGRVLWSREIIDGGGGVRNRYDLSKVSGDRMGNPIFGTPPTGYHFLVDEDALYLAYPDRCLVLSPRSGEDIGVLKLPSDSDEWGRIRAYRDLLIVPVLEPRSGEKQRLPSGEKQRLPHAIIAMDRHSGEVRWTRKAKNAFPFLSLGRDRVFCFDVDLERLYRDRRRKNAVPKASGVRTVIALNAATGEEHWSKEIDVTATWLAFSDEHEVLVASNSEEILAMHGSDGYTMWRKKSQAKSFGGHPENLVHKVILWRDRVIDQRGPGLAYDLKTGEDVTMRHPLTGDEVAWEFTKTGHHCNYAIASEHLITFRAASAGFFDLINGGTSRLEGFRSGCRNSLIPADGVLNAPNFANGCICSYSIFTSLALIHVPENDKWSYSALKLPEQRVQRLGVNLGAPGDRRDKSGTLWLDHPGVGGPSPNVAVKSEPDKPQWFRRLSRQVRGEGPAWVAASGAIGLSSLTVELEKKAEDDAPSNPVPYTVRLHFAEPDDVAPGERVFTVALQGREVLRDFDVAREAGGRHRAVVREFRGIRIESSLKVDLTSKVGKTVICGVEVISERERQHKQNPDGEG